MYAIASAFLHALPPAASPRMAGLGSLIDRLLTQARLIFAQQPPAIESVQPQIHQPVTQIASPPQRLLYSTGYLVIGAPGGPRFTGQR
jgi:hypothetical protein